MNSPATRNPNSNPGRTFMITAGVTLGLGFVGILHLGRLVNDEPPLPLNPFETIRVWAESGKEWGRWHTTFAVILTLMLIGALFLIIRSMGRRAAKREHIDAKARLMGKGTSMSLKQVTIDNDKAGYTSHDVKGMHLGRMVSTRKDLYAGFRSTVLAIMGTGSGKTSAVAVPQAWNAPGFVYGTSNKRDFTDPIWGFREKRGKVRVFDPQNIAEAPCDWYWDPLSFVVDDVHAKMLANLWADAGIKGDMTKGGDPFWDNAGRDLVAGLLLAAAMGERPVTDIVTWLSEPNRDDPIMLLRKGRAISPTRPKGWTLMADRLNEFYGQAAETKRGIFGNASQIVSFLVNSSAEPWIRKIDEHDTRPQLDVHEFVRSDSDTLISLSMEGVGSLGPLVASLTTAVMEAAEDYAKRCTGGRLPIPGVFILDEAANVVRIRDLPDKYSHYASRGLFLTTILQSYAQGVAAWGATGMDKLMGAATHVMIGRGIKDEKFLKALSELTGPFDELHFSSGTSSGGGMLGGGRGGRSTNANYVSKPVLSVADLHAMPEWRSLIFASGERPVLVELIPYFRDPKSELALAVVDSVQRHGPSVGVTV